MPNSSRLEAGAQANVSTPHQQHTAYHGRWTKVRDVVEGEEAVKGRGEVYLPALSGQNQNSYDAYRMRALWLDATHRTLLGFQGMVFRTDPDIQAKDPVKEGWLTRCTKDNRPIGTLLRRTLNETLTAYRYGLLLDMSEQGAAEPFIAGYEAENIINWDTQYDENGREILTLVILREEIEERVGRFGSTVVEQMRELRLTAYDSEDDEQTNEAVADAASLIYRQQVWRKRGDIPKEYAGIGDKEEWLPYGEEIVPTVRGLTIPYIPFCIVTANDTGVDIHSAPLEGIANVNLSHYRSSADLEHGRHFCGLPTPWAAGFDVKTELAIGSATAWVTENEAAKVGMLEFTGQGLGALEKALEEKLQYMAILGARMLEEPKQAAERFETHKIRRSGEESVLANIAITISDCLNTVFAWATDWFPELGEISVMLNTDYGMPDIQPTKMAELLKALIAGKMSPQAFFYNLEQGGVYPEGWTYEDEMDAIEAATPEPPAPIVEESEEDEESDDDDEGEEEDEDEGEEAEDQE